MRGASCCTVTQAAVPVLLPCAAALSLQDRTPGGVTQVQRAQWGEKGCRAHAVVGVSPIPRLGLDVPLLVAIGGAHAPESHRHIGVVVGQQDGCPATRRRPRQCQTSIKILMGVLITSL